MVFNMIEPTIYTFDNGQTYNIDFNKTKDHIKYTTLKTVKFLTMDDLIRLRDKIDKITINFKNFNVT